MSKHWNDLILSMTMDKVQLQLLLHVQYYLEIIGPGRGSWKDILGTLPRMKYDVSMLSGLTVSFSRPPLLTSSRAFFNWYEAFASL